MDEKITQLTETLTVVGTDLAVVVTNPATTPVTQKIQIANLGSSLGMPIASNTVSSQLAFGLSATPGILTNYSRGDHNHGTPSGQALTKTDDTNVTLTLGGTPATALLLATSLTLGWTGLLAPSRGGTGLSALDPAVLGNGTAQYQYPVTGATPFTPAWSTGFLNIGTGKTLTVNNTLTLAAASDGLTLTAEVSGYPIVRLAGANPAPQVVADPLNGNARGQYTIDLQLLRNDATQVAGAYSDVVIGIKNKTTTSTSIAIGSENTVDTAPYGLAIGGQNTVSAIYGVLVGTGNALYVGSDNSTGIGYANDVTGLNDVSIGNNNNITGNYNVALGNGVVINAGLSMGTGRRPVISHNGAFIYGDSTNADFNSKADNEFAIRARGGFRHAYDNSNYWTAQVSSVGAVTFAATGAGAKFTFPALNLSNTSNQLVLQSAGVTGTLTWTPTTSNKVITLPDATGTLALTSDLPVGANPTASVELTAVNGVATTFMRSDAAPALDVGINPTWSGNHVFSNDLTISTGTFISTVADGSTAKLITLKSTATLPLNANLANEYYFQLIDGSNNARLRLDGNNSFIIQGEATQGSNTLSDSIIISAGKNVNAGGYIAPQFTLTYDPTLRYTNIAAGRISIRRDVSNYGIETRAYIDGGVNDGYIQLNQYYGEIVARGVYETTGYLTADNGMVMRRTNATTNAVDDVITLRHNSTGTPANGFGGSIGLQGASSTTASQAMGLDQWLWVDATHATRKARRVFSVYDSVGAKIGLQFEADGTSTNAIAKIGGGAGLITFSAAADYTLTVPATGTAALLGTANVFTATQTISNTAPSLVFTDTTASAKGLTIAVDANIADLRESAGASGSLLALDLANNRVGIGTSTPGAKLHIEGNTTGFGLNNGNARFLMNVDTNYNPSIELHTGKTGFNKGFAAYLDFAVTDDADFNTRIIRGNGVSGISNALLFMSDATVFFGGVSDYAGTANYLQIHSSGLVGIGVAGTPAYKLQVLGSDNINNAVANVYGLGKNVTGGHGADGLGVAMIFTLADTTTDNTGAARIYAQWGASGSATHASYKGDLVATVYDSGGERELWRGRASGSAAMLGLYGATPVVQPTGDLFAGLIGLGANASPVIPNGSMYLDDGSIAVTVSATVTEYAVGAGLSAGSTTSFTFSNSTLTCNVAGTYECHWSMAFSSSNNNEIIEGGIMVNTTAVAGSGMNAENINGGKDTCVSGNVILTLALNDVVKLYVENDTAIHNITVTHATVTLTRIA